MIRFAGWRIIFIGVVLAVVCAGGAWALVQQLPPGGQVNSDAAKGIDPTIGLSGEAPNADVVGGSLTATTGKAVPWAIFRQKESPPGSGKDQIFVRSFAGGLWATRGTGTFGGRSDASVTFPASLNFDQTTDGEAPEIDFAGAGRAVPWATWYENTSNFGADNIFASRFDSNPDTHQNKWLFAGQGRGLAGGTVPVPSLNIHTGKDAVNPSVAGGAAGATADQTKPGPWITWQEEGFNAPGQNKDQIFVVKPTQPQNASPPVTNCDGVAPLGVVDGSGHIPEVNGFCWQQVGIERLGTDPSLNIDRTRDGVEPDIAFTGTNDSVPWVVWYEHGSGLNGVTNEMVFAAKGVTAGTVSGTVDGGFHWVAVGRGTAGQTNPLDTSAGGAGPCAASLGAEQACSLNKTVTANAEDPRVAAGTMVAGTPTVPWVVWDEDVSGTTQIFVSRLVSGDHFEVTDNGAPISVTSNPSTRPDITFSGNTPYVSWRENIGGTDKGFLGHFVLNGTTPIFQLDDSSISLTPSGTPADVRLPISSGCTANFTNADGSVCQGGAVGTPFALFTNGTSPLGLFADAYQPGTPTTGTASSVTSSSATVSGSVDQVGGPVNVSFNFGTTTAYGQTTTPQKLTPAGGNTPTSTPFAASLTGLPASSTIHYQAVVTTDFGTALLGGDQTLQTQAPPDTTAPKVSAKIANSTIKKLLSSGKLKVKVTINEAGKVNLSASTKVKAKHHKHKTVKLGSAKATFTKAGSKTVKITVPSSAAGKLRSVHGGTKITVSFFGTDTAGNKSKKKTTSAVFPRR